MTPTRTVTLALKKHISTDTLDIYSSYLCIEKKKKSCTVHLFHDILQTHTLKKKLYFQEKRDFSIFNELMIYSIFTKPIVCKNSELFAVFEQNRTYSLNVLWP